MCATSVRNDDLSSILTLLVFRSIPLPSRQTSQSLYARNESTAKSRAACLNVLRSDLLQPLVEVHQISERLEMYVFSRSTDHACFIHVDAYITPDLTTSSTHQTAWSEKTRRHHVRQHEHTYSGRCRAGDPREEISPKAKILFLHALWLRCLRVDHLGNGTRSVQPVFREWRTCRRRLWLHHCLVFDLVRLHCDLRTCKHGSHRRRAILLGVGFEYLEMIESS
jgi:hypothetical protein